MSPKNLKINQLSFCLWIFIENGTPRYQLLFRDSTLFCIFLTCIIFGHYSCFSDEFKWFLKPLMMANYYACSYFWCGYHFVTVWQNNCFILKRLSSQYRKRNLRIVCLITKLSKKPLKFLQKFVSMHLWISWENLFIEIWINQITLFWFTDCPKRVIYLNSKVCLSREL